QIAAAITMRTLYPANHPRVIQTVDEVGDGVGARLLEQTRADSVTYLIVGDDLVVDQEVIRRTTLSVHQFIELLKRRGIERLTLAAGLQQDEAHQLVGALALGEPLESSDHIVVGHVHVAVHEEEQRKGAGRELSVEQLELMREA